MASPTVRFSAKPESRVWEPEVSVALLTCATAETADDEARPHLSWPSDWCGPHDFVAAVDLKGQSRDVASELISLAAGSEQMQRGSRVKMMINYPRYESGPGSVEPRVELHANVQDGSQVHVDAPLVHWKSPS